MLCRKNEQPVHIFTAPALEISCVAGEFTDKIETDLKNTRHKNIHCKSPKMLSYVGIEQRTLSAVRTDES